MNVYLFALLFLLSWILIYAFVRHLMIEEWLDNYEGRRGNVLWLVSAAIIVILSAWGSYAIIRYLYFQPEEEHLRSGIVRDKDYDPPYTSHGFIMAGKVMVPTTHYHPARHWLLVDGKSQKGTNLKDWIDVGQNAFDAYSNGDSIYFKPMVIA